MLKKLNSYFGFNKEEQIYVDYPNTYNFTDTLNLKIEYLKALDTQESSRQSIIESKTSQIIGQAGIIFSLLSLFISNYFSKFRELPFFIQYLFISLFFITLFFYLVTIFQATKYLNVKKYAYAQRSVSTVMAKYEKDEDFKIEELKDLIYSINKNTTVNNQKCNNLIYAYRSFKIGTIGVGLLSVLLILSGYFIVIPTTDLIKIKKVIVIEKADSVTYKIPNIKF